MRAEDRRLGADRSAAARGRRSGARSGRGRAARLRRRDPRARSARRPGDRRRAVRRRLARSADAGAIYPPERVAPRSRTRAAGCPALQVEGLRAEPPRWRSRAAEDRRAGSTTRSSPHVLGPEPASYYRHLVGPAHRCTSASASSFGLRRDDLIVKDGDMFAVEERLAALRDVARRTRRRSSRRPARPSVRVQTATAWAAEAAKLGIDEAIAETSRGSRIVHFPARRNARRGPRFGTLVHAVLATVPLDASAESIVAHRGDTGPRSWSAGATKSAPRRPSCPPCLNHDLMRRARAPNGCGGRRRCRGCRRTAR